MNKPGYLTFIVLLVVILTACATPIQGSPTNVQTQALISTKGMIRPGDKIGEMTIERQRSLDYYRLLDVFDFDFTINAPHSQTVERTLPELSVVGVNFGWVALKTNIESNWEAMSEEIFIDDYQLALDQFGWEDINYFESPGTEVTIRYWNIILRNLSAGKHTF